MNDAIPLLLIAGLGYYLYSTGALSKLASDSTAGSTAASTILGGGKITVTPGNLPSDAVTDGTDLATSGYWQGQLNFAQTVTAMSSQYREMNIAGIQDMEQIEARESIPANTQLIKASYERFWADRLNKLQLPISEWTRLRGQYISQYGGEEPNPPLQIFRPDVTGNIPASQYLNLINDWRRSQSKPSLGGLGCSECGGTCKGMGYSFAGRPYQGWFT